MRLVEWHFWLAVLGLFLYIAVYLFGRTMYPGEAVAIVQSNVHVPSYAVLAKGIQYTLVALGMLIMAYNLWKTVTAQAAQTEPAS